MLTHCPTEHSLVVHPHQQWVIKPEKEEGEVSEEDEDDDKPQVDSPILGFEFHDAKGKLKIPTHSYKHPR